MSQEKILIFGPARTILNLTLPEMPAAPESIGTAYETTLGGQGENLAVAVARLGGRAVFCGRVGDDSGGKRLVRLLDAAGVDLSAFHVDREAQTGLLVRTTAGATERRILFPGAGGGMRDEEIRAAFLGAPGALCLSAEPAPEVLALAGKLAAERGIPIFLTVTGQEASDKTIAALPMLEIFSPDEAATLALTGIRPAGAESCLQTVIELQKKIKAKYYVIRLGDRGAFVYDGTYCHMVASYFLPQTDRRGSDDAFFGAMVLEYLRAGQEILPACAYAAAAAALCATRRGETVSIPTADEVLSFLERN